MERLRIGLLSYEYPPETGFGGIGTYTWTQAQALARAGHQVHVLAGGAPSASPHGAIRSEPDGPVTVWRDAGSPAVRRLAGLLGAIGWWWSRNRLENGARMRRLLRRVADQNPLDVVEVPECGGEGLFLEAAWDRRKVVRFHSPAELIMPFYATRRGDRRFCAWLERRGYRRAAAATACSRYLSRALAEQLAFAAPVVTIPNGIDLALADGASPLDLRREIGAGPEESVVLFAGRFEPRKGSALLCDLVPELLGRRPARFVVLGDDLFGLAKGELAARCAARGSSGRLHLLGRRSSADVRAALRQADVLLLPSRWENAPYAVLEAMASGRPVVASRVGGIPEMAMEEHEALLAEDADMAEHLAAVERLLDDGDLARRLGRAARARVEREFTADRMAASSLEIYQRVAQAGE